MTAAVIAQADYLDDPQAISPEDHVWSDRKLAWLELGDDLPRYKRGKFDE